MADLDPRVTALLERAADGPVGDPAVEDIVRRGARRRRLRSTALTATAAVATAAVVSTVAIVATSSSDRRSQPARPGPSATTPGPISTNGLAGVTAPELAHGTWTNIPAAPVKLCGQTSVVWTGSVVVTITGEDTVTCASGAAAYDPKANRWHRLDAPPPGINGQLVLVSAGDRVVAVSQLRGTAAALDVASGRWQSLPSLPSPAAQPLAGVVATGLAVGADVVVVGVGKAGDQAFRLPAGQNTWTELPRLPHPSDYTVVATAGYSAGGKTWVAMTTEKRHFNKRAHTLNVQTAYSVLELQHDQWLDRGHDGLPFLVNAAQALGPDALVVAGGCLPGMGCPYAPPLILLADFRGGSSQRIAVSPLGGTTHEVFSTGAAVLVYDASGEESGGGVNIRPGATAVYDVKARRWLKAPHSARVENIAGEVWTSYGFVVLGQLRIQCASLPGCSDGQILRPHRG